MSYFSYNSGETTLDFFTENKIFALPEDERVIPATARVALAEAAGDMIMYQLIRAHYHVGGEWLRGDIDVKAYERDYDFISDAIRLRGREKRLTPLDN